MTVISSLTPDNAFIFRIVHRDNLEWILGNGVHCRNSATFDPKYINIGNTELIGKRSTKVVPISPGGSLSDYVPFYFTPRSPMLLNIKTGYNGVTKRSNSEIVILVSSLKTLRSKSRPFVFTNQHAYVPNARFFDDLSRLTEIDWGILQQSDFKRDNDDLGKVNRYQAEALIHQHIPVDHLIGIACNDASAEARINSQIAAAGLQVKVAQRPRWYF